MFKYYRILPDVIDKQEPKMLLEILDNLNDSEASEEYTGSDPYLRMFYGM